MPLRALSRRLSSSDSRPAERTAEPVAEPGTIGSGSERLLLLLVLLLLVLLFGIEVASGPDGAADVTTGGTGGLDALPVAFVTPPDSSPEDPQLLFLRVGNPTLISRVGAD